MKSVSLTLVLLASVSGCALFERGSGSKVNAEGGTYAGKSPIETSFLHGLWEGVARTTGREGQQDLRAQECLYPKLDGVVTVVEGKHVNGHGEEVFRTLGLLSSKEGNRYDCVNNIRSDTLLWCRREPDQRQRRV